MTGDEHRCRAGLSEAELSGLRGAEIAGIAQALAKNCTGAGIKTPTEEQAWETSPQREFTVCEDLLSRSVWGMQW